MDFSFLWLYQFVTRSNVYLIIFVYVMVLGFICQLLWKRWQLVYIEMQWFNLSLIFRFLDTPSSSVGYDSWTLIGRVELVKPLPKYLTNLKCFLRVTINNSQLNSREYSFIFFVWLLKGLIHCTFWLFFSVYASYFSICWQIFSLMKRIRHLTWYSATFHNHTQECWLLLPFFPLFSIPLASSLSLYVFVISVGIIVRQHNLSALFSLYMFPFIDRENK